MFFEWFQVMAKLLILVQKYWPLRASKNCNDFCFRKTEKLVLLYHPSIKDAPGIIGEHKIQPRGASLLSKQTNKNRCFLLPSKSRQSIDRLSFVLWRRHERVWIRQIWTMLIKYFGQYFAQPKAQESFSTASWREQKEFDSK